MFIKSTILKGTEHICLFCGKEINSKYDEYDEYWECDCADAKKDRRILNKIEDLKRSRPKHKYEIHKANILQKKEDYFE